MLKLILILTGLFSLVMTFLIYKKLKKLRYGIVEYVSLQTIFLFVMFFLLIFGFLVKLIDAMFITVF